ncbi:hypothetical protein [Brevibacillus sp. NRS-1366]|uniref:hypothetical protein n=1 Tax=Brevibacillus sp. NRS-1366 TaxID=3233899 RepID=UPI003D20D2DF
MTHDEIWEWMQRDLDGDLSSGEQQLLYSLLQKDPELQLMYNRLKNVSEQLEKLPPVVPSFSIVDSILPRLELAAATKPAAVPVKNEEILPTLEVKRKSSAPSDSKKWKRMKVWLASIGSTAVAACLMIGMLFTGSDGKKPEIDTYQQGSVSSPPVDEKIVRMGPDVPTPSTNPSPSNTSEEEKKPDKKPSEKKQSTKTPAKQTQKKPDTKAIANPAITNPPVAQKPVAKEDKQPAFPIGIKDNQDREDRRSAKDDEDDDRDKSKNKNKEKKDKKQDNDDD